MAIYWKSCRLTLLTIPALCWFGIGKIPPALAQPILPADRHNVFLIHGLKGNAGSFCDLGQVLKERYWRKEKNGSQGERDVFDASIRSIEYSTQSHTLTPRDFAIELTQQILYHWEVETLDRNAPYSFIMHSQGGLVGLRYLYACYGAAKIFQDSSGNELVDRGCGYDINRDLKTDEHDLREIYSKLPMNFRLFLTLGTPYWGSPRALALADQSGFQKLAGFPGMQLQGLAYGSRMIQDLREQVLAQRLGENTFFPDDVELISVGGNLTKEDLELSGVQKLATYVARLGLANIEYDVAVDVPASRLDFIYRLEDPANPNRSRQGKSNFADNSQDRTYFLNYAHMPFAGIDGLPCVTQADAQADNHDAYKIMRDALDRHIHGKGREEQPHVKQSDLSMPGELNNFGIELVVRLPEGYARPLLFEKGKTYHLTALSSEIDSLDVGQNYFYQASVQRYDEETARQILVDHGRVRAGAGFAPAEEKTSPLYEVEYRFTFPGWIERSTQDLIVSPSYTTYAEIFLQPYLPIKIDRERAQNGIFWVSLRDTQKGLNAVRVNLKTGRFLEPQIYGQADLHKAGIPAIAQENKNQCYTAQMGTIVPGKHDGGVYVDFYDRNALLMLAQGQELQVYGRLGVKNKQGEWDRYLVSVPGRSTFARTYLERPIGPNHLDSNLGLAWVNVKDVDVLQGVDCPK